MPIGLLPAIGKQRLQTFRQIRCHRHGLQALAQAGHDLLLVLPIAAQIQPLSDQHQGPAAGLGAALRIDHGALRQLPLPLLETQMCQALRG